MITSDMIKELRRRTGIGVGKCKEALRESNGDIELAIKNLRKAGMATAVKKEGRETREGLIATAESSDGLALVEINAETDFVVANENFQKFAAEIAEATLEGQPDSVEALAALPVNGMTADEHRASLVQSLGENIQFKRLHARKKAADTSYGLYSHMGGKIVCMVEIAGSADEEQLARDIAMHIAAEAPEYLNADAVPAEVRAHEEEIARSQMKGKPENIIEKILKGKMQAYFKQVCLLNQPYVRDSDLTVAQLVEKRAKEVGKPLTVRSFLRWGVGE